MHPFSDQTPAIPGLSTQIVERTRFPNNDSDHSINVALVASVHPHHLIFSIYTNPLTMRCTFLLLSILFLSTSPSRSALITFPPPIAIEGVNHYRGSLFLGGDISTGDILLIDARTSAIATIVRAPPDRAVLGIYSDFRTRRIFAAGAGPLLPSLVDDAVPNIEFPNSTSTLNVYDFTTGREIASCAVPDAQLVVDVTSDGTNAYFTDAFRPSLYQLRLAALPRCAVSAIPLVPRLFQGAGPRANGIAAYRGGLLVTNFELGALYFVDPLRDNRVTPVLPVGAARNASGIDIVRRSPAMTLLFMAQSELSQVSVYRLSFWRAARRARVRLMGVVKSELFAVTPTVAVSADVLMVSSLNFTKARVGEPLSVVTVPLDEALTF